MKITNLLNKKKLQKASFPEFDTDSYMEIADVSDFCEDKPVSSSSKVSLVCLGQNGVYVFILSKSEDTDVLLNDVARAQQKYRLNTNGVYIFVRTHEKDYFYEAGKLHEIESALEGFSNLYLNTQRPSIDLNYIGFSSDLDMLQEPELPEAYKDENGNAVEVECSGDVSFVSPRISENMLLVIAKRFDEAREDLDDKTEYVDENGVKYRKHYATSANGLWVSSEQWYPVADDDPVRFFFLTLFGGIFGLHKFKTKEYLKGLFYLLTCGGFGIFYVMDVISIATGNYFVTQVSYSDNGNQMEKYKQKIYLDRLPKLSYKLSGIVSSVAIAYVAYVLVYIPILSFIGSGAIDTVLEKGNEMVETSDYSEYESLDLYEE